MAIETNNQNSIWDRFLSLVNPSSAQTFAQPDTNQWSPTGNTATNAPATNGLGMNTGTLQLGLSGLSSLGSLWGGLQAQKLAKDQFNFTKDVTNTNLANQIKSYNTSLEDRIRSRTITEGGSTSDAEAYLAKNRL